MEPPLQSPALAKVRPGDQRSIDHFWAQRRAEGTPLVESAPKEPGHSLVTFLWRSIRPCHVEVSSALQSDWRQPESLTRLPGTDVWYRSYVTRSDIRTVYFFTTTPMPPPSASEPEWLRFSRTLGPDPLNPQSFHFPPDPEDPDDVAQSGSILSLPQAPPRPHFPVLATSARADLSLHRYQSRVLGNERRVWLYRPPHRPRPSARRPSLLVVLDGHAYLNLVPAPARLDALQQQGRLGPTYGIFVDSVSNRLRSAELPCNPKFAKFLAEELVPWGERQLGCRVPGSRTTLLGSSLGGLGAAFAAFRYPGRFGRVLSQSGTFAWSRPGDDPETLTRAYAEARPKPVRFYVEAGVLEHGGGSASSILSANRHFRDVLRAKGNEIQYAEYPGGHDYLWWADTLGPALTALSHERKSRARR